MRKTSKQLLGKGERRVARFRASEMARAIRAAASAGADLQSVTVSPNTGTFTLTFNDVAAPKVEQPATS